MIRTVSARLGRLRRLPIRWRLTLWYAALMTVTLAVFGVAIYAGMRYRLYDSFDEQLQNHAAVTLGAVRFEEGVPVLDPGISGDNGREYFVRLVGDDGFKVLADTRYDGKDIALDAAAIAAALDGRSGVRTSRADTDELLRVVTLPVRDGERIAGVLEVGLDRNEIDDTIGELLFALALTVPVALAVAIAAGYALAGRALRPVAAITDLAARIGGRDLHARLDLDLPDDELGRLARTFDGMLARIEEAFERQRRFTGDAAHELRTPLSLMRSQLDVTRARRRTVEDYEVVLADLDGDLERITDLVARLLTVARADSGHLLPEREPLDLAVIVRLVLDQYAGQADAAGVLLDDETAPTPCVADAGMMIQVLVNLLDNALAHTPTGGRIAAGCAPGGDMARLWVADTGSGIPAEHVERVFDRFYRVDFGRTRAMGGTGLGLAICRAIAEAHGGSVRLSSTVGTGTRAEVVVPVAPIR